MLSPPLEPGSQIEVGYGRSWNPRSSGTVLVLPNIVLPEQTIGIRGAKIVCTRLQNASMG